MLVELIDWLFGGQKAAATQLPGRSWGSFLRESRSAKGFGIHSPYLYQIARKALGVKGKSTPQWLNLAKSPNARKMARQIEAIAVAIEADAIFLPLSVINAQRGEPAIPIHALDDTKGSGEMVQELMHFIRNGNHNKPLVAWLPCNQWGQLTAGQWETLTHSLPDGSWLALPAIREGDKEWEHWQKIASSLLFSVGLDCWEHGFLLRKRNIGPHRLGIR